MSSHFNLSDWQEMVSELHIHMDTVTRGRRTLKESIEGHLKNHFTGFEKIDYDDSFYFNKVILKWGDEVDFPVLDKIDIGMPFKVSKGFDDSLGFGIWIVVYPFGLEEGDN